MGYKLAGKIKVIEEAQTFASGFTKRQFVVTVEDGKFPQDIALECLQDKVTILDDVSDGDFVDVDFDIRGREYGGRYFNNLVAWRISCEQKSDDGYDGSDGYGAPPVVGGSDNDGYDDTVPF